MACGAPAARYYEGAGRPSSLNYGVGHNHWFLFVIVTSFILTFLWSLFYFLQLKESINMKLPFSWLKLVSFQFKKSKKSSFNVFVFILYCSKSNCVFLSLFTVLYLLVIYKAFSIAGVVLYICGYPSLYIGMDCTFSRIWLVCWQGNM